MTTTATTKACTIAGRILSILTVTAAAWGAPAWAQQEATGAGASFPAPLYSKWAADYHKATGVKINYQSVGSSAGIKQIEAKTVDFGASDEPLKDADLQAKGLVQFPTVIGGIVPVVNIKGIKPGELKLTGQVLAISTWAKSPNGTTLPSLRSILVWPCPVPRSARCAVPMARARPLGLPTTSRK